MILVQGDERMEKLSPAELRQRRQAARARRQVGYAHGSAPRSQTGRRVVMGARVLGAGIVIAGAGAGAHKYRQRGIIHAQDLAGQKTRSVTGESFNQYEGPRSASADDVASRIAGMRAGAKKRQKVRSRR